MARLRTAAPRVGRLQPRLARPAPTEAERSRFRDAADGWRAWYKTARWQKLRWSVLVRDLFTCAMCGRVEGDTSKLVCDHVEPHRGDEARFWAGPFQTLCKPCHDGTKQRIERRRGGRNATAYPGWLRRSAIPLTIVAGPPAAGKSRYIAERRRPNDVVIDLDVIAAGLVGGEVRHDWDREAHLQDALWRRNAMLADLSRRTGGAAWLALLEPSADRRAWWQERLGAAEVVVIEASVETCLRHAARDADRRSEAVEAAASAWWRAYGRRPCETVVAPAMGEGGGGSLGPSWR